MVTYSDLLQFGTFIVALISLLYQIFKDKPVKYENFISHNSSHLSA